LGGDIALYPKQQILDVDLEFIDTPWHKRGWIFQESLLSRQRLIFLPSAVVLRCEQQSISPNFLMARQSEWPGGVKTDLELRSTLKVTEWSFQNYQRIVDNYCDRDLTFESDALKAISGVLSRITRQTGMAFRQGLPTEHLQLLNALFWFPRTSKSTKHRWGLRSGQAYLRRRPGFASWSWLSFDGPAYYPFWLTPRPHAARSEENLALQVRRDSGLYISSWMNSAEFTTFDVSLLEVAGFEFKTGSNDENLTLTITTESARFPFSFSPGLPPKWTLAVTMTSNENHDSLNMSGFTSWSTQLSEFSIERDLFSKVPGAGGKADIELLMLAHINGPNCGDEVFAMAVARTNLEDVVERLAIIVVPYACWELAEPEIVTVDII